MSAFLFAATLLLASALCFILPTLLRKQPAAGLNVQRDAINLALLREQLRELDADLADGAIGQEAYRSARHELEQRVAEEVQPSAPIQKIDKSLVLQAAALGSAIVLGAGALYVYLGNPRGLDPAIVAANAPPAKLTRAQAEAMVEKIAQKMKAQPDNAEGWFILARSYTAMKRYPEAADAYAHLTSLVPGEAEYLVNYADVLAMTQGKSLRGEPENLLKRALAASPGDIKALLLIGSAQFERGDYVAAVASWKKIAPLAAEDSEIARLAASNIEDAQVRIAADPASAAALKSAARKSLASGDRKSALAEKTSVNGTVELAPELRKEVAGTDTVFIFARAAQGPRFPLAVLRKQVKDLPIAFTLDDSMSMMPDAKLSAYPLLVVGARISRSGSATAGKGDLEGTVSSVTPGDKVVKIRIDTRRD